MKLPSGRIYLDHNATTPLDPRVARVHDAAQARLFGNASSAHREGREAKAALEEAREKIAAFAGCKVREVVFTGSGTEANHLALRSAALARPERLRVLLSSVEHPSVSAQKEFLEASGLTVEEIPVLRSGALDLGWLEKAGGSDIAVVCVMAAHNETGVLMDVEAVGRFCQQHGAYFHTDAVQAAGKVPLPWSSASPHYLALAGHKIYGPKGVGVLIVREGAPVIPLLVGGGQEGGRRASTEAVPLAMAFGAACELAAAAVEDAARIRKLRDGMELEIKKRRHAVVHGEASARLPNTSFFSLPGPPASSVVKRLDEAGIAVSTGSACHSGGGESPAVLSKMGVAGLPEGLTLRVSLGRGTCEADVVAFLSALAGVLEGSDSLT